VPTFGNTGTGIDTFPTTNDRGFFGLFTLPDTADVTEIAVRFDATSVAGDPAKGLIYDGVAGGDLRLATTGQVVPGGGGLLTWAVSGLTLSPGDYYLGSVIDGFNAVWQGEPGAGERVEAVTYASPSATMGTLNSTGIIPDAYVTYDIGGNSVTVKVHQLRQQGIA
jgi:hypothetical protein